MFSFLYFGQRNEWLYSAVCKFSVYSLILLITFDTEGGFIEKTQKKRLRGRLIEVELLENIRPERKVAP